MREWRRCRKCWEVIESVEGWLGTSKVRRTWSEENRVEGSMLQIS